jgi:hypothetical protein
MPTDKTNEQAPKVVIDDDWKNQVKAEDAALDQKRREDAAEKKEGDEQPAPSEAAEPSERIDPSQIPPASFSTLVAMFSTQAMVAMGVIPNPATGKPDLQLELARHFIDLLGVLDKTSQGNLDAGEAALLENTLHQLRMAFVELTKNSAEPNPTDPTP